MATDAVKLLKNDHRTVESLFSRFESASEPTQRKLLVEEIIRELSIHASLEEQFLYPAVQQSLPEGERLAREARQEHHEMKEALSDLDGMDGDHPELVSKVRGLIQDVNHHVAEEETEMFPRLQKALRKKRLREMGEAMEVGRLVAPTRPHPRAPDTPPGVVVAGAAAAVVDRARDAARDVSRRVTGAPREPAKRAPAGKKRSSRTPAKKRPAKRAATKRTSAKKTAARKAPARKKSTAKRTTTRKAPARKKSTAAKKSTAKRTTTRKAAPRRAA
jgi:hemerythrin superfamily protein